VTLTSTVDTLSHPMHHEGIMAEAMFAIRLDSVMPSKRLRFPRAARLLRHADFECVYKQGRRHFSASMTVFYLARPSNIETQAAAAHGMRIGFTVGRALGGAVQRNRMKRRLREAVRLSRPAVGVDADIVINPKKSLLTADFADILSEVNRALAVIGQRLAQNSSQKLTPDAANNKQAGSGNPKARNQC
jgi:ribonuclease P protein component